jgi:thiamine pyrophosphokinase
MCQKILRTSDLLTLLGGGKVRADELAQALALAPCLVAADGAATTALRAGHIPRAVIGDMDSIPEAVRRQLPADTLHEIADQDSTDFDKALRSVSAPLVLGVGFLGRRVDHQLANFNVLIRRCAQPCILIGKRDIVFAAPPSLSLDLAPGMRVSLFPLAPVRGRSTGLHWPIDGLDFAPDGTIGTSNRVADGTRRVELAFDAPGMLLILPRAALGAAIAALIPSK